MVSPSKNLDKHHKVNEVQEKIKMQRNGVQALQAQRQEEEQRKEREKEKERERKRREKAKEEKDKEDVEMGGIYSLSDKQLGDRWNFEEEIGECMKELERTETRGVLEGESSKMKKNGKEQSAIDPSTSVAVK